MTTYSVFIAPFVDYGFMRRALVACLALGLGSAPIGVLLMLRRMSLVGDAMSHAILPGAAVGFLGRCADIDNERIAVGSHADRNPHVLQPLRRIPHRHLDRRLAGAVHVGDAVNHGLGRVDLAVAPRTRIGTLALAVGWAAERIAPAEIVPIVDGIRERDDARLLGELAKKRVRRRTGRAALAREQLDHRGRRAGARHAGSGKCESRERSKAASAWEKEGPHGAYNAG